MMDLRTEDLVRFRGEASEIALARAVASITEGLLHGSINTMFIQRSKGVVVLMLYGRLNLEQPHCRPCSKSLEECQQLLPGMEAPLIDNQINVETYCLIVTSQQT